MKLAVPRETVDGERRVALVPESVRKLVKAGLDVFLQCGAGEPAWVPDEEYAAAGAKTEPDASRLFADADILLKVQAPRRRSDMDKHEASMMKRGAIFISTLRPLSSLEAVRLLASGGVTSLAMDCIPRITRAQSMDVLSSQATIAGYKAVLIAGNHLGKMFPMMMTAAGTILPAKVLVIGAGVAGLQAIATARRLGATVEAFDTRPVVKEQVESLGAKFITVEMPETGEAEDAGGYAKELSAEFYRREMELLGERGASADIVITTALIGGVKAPLLIPEENVKRMKPGSVIVDLAAEAGGNCALANPGQTVVRHGVTICAPLNLPAEMPVHASQMYSRNVTTFILEFFKNGSFTVDRNDEIIKGCLVTHQGEVMHAPTRQALEKSGDS